ncbi:MAG: hypothetical protein ACHQAY_22540 [Hyphomicrobiales bacterium]
MSTGLHLRRAVLGFVAGFVTVLTIFQLGILLLYWFGALSNPPSYMSPTAPFGAPTAPFGVPSLFSAAFFGGLWGILFAFAEPRFPQGPAYWVTAFLFGAILLDLVLWFVVAPLKGRPLGYGFAPRGMSIGVFLHGVWGGGMGLIYRMTRGAVGV